MLATLTSFEERITLIMNTGVQFLDLGLTLDLHRETGQFIANDAGPGLLRLVYDDQRGTLHRPDHPEQTAKPQLQVALGDSLRLFDGVWLPIPLLRQNPPHRYANGPETWARARLVALAPSEQDRAPTGEAAQPGPVPPGEREGDRHTHRLTIAIDTTVFADDPERRYLTPIDPDVQAGATFELAHASEHVHWFPALPWVDGWLGECLDDWAEKRLHLARNDLEQAKRTLVHQAHYLNLLALIGQHTQVPWIRLASNRRDNLSVAINVDMVLDIGNSRSFGILVEQHPREHDVLHSRYTLELRDLSRSELVYDEPFESRVELTQPFFGKEHWAARSGRSGAFQWPTIGRVGPEAARLAGARRGTEGVTGISSPKRYLWDTERFPTGWRFNSAGAPGAPVAHEPQAVAPPVSMLVNEEGRALFDLPQDERMPVFRPHYSRSAMMTFMLAEVLAQALRQINSAHRRLLMPNADLPRQLRTIVLTTPPSMPKQERDIFECRIREAVVIIWKALRWHPEDAPVDWECDQAAWPPFPAIEIRWDEATCGQVVYLYAETQEHYGGRTSEFFGRAARRCGPDHGRRLRIATVDIGGGTTDLVINDYLHDTTDRGQKAFLIPEQRFRDGFRIAGDDLVLQLIRTLLMPAFERALRAIGIQNVKPVLARLMGAEHLDVRDRVMRQQLSVQLLYPAGLALLALCEEYDPLRGADTRTLTLGALVARAGGGPPSQAVRNFIQNMVVGQAGATEGGFDPLAITVSVDLALVHQLFMGDQFELGRPIRSLCEVIYRYDCDVLLLTGRPSRLPGIQSLFRALLPLPPDRIIPLHHYPAGTWYPFHHLGLIEDPKTTAAVGAMLCMLGHGRLTNFFLHSSAFRPYSTVRHLGVMDNNMVIGAQDLLYSDLRLDEKDYELPQCPFQVLGLTRIGYRQIPVDRWAASPLYQVAVDRSRCDQHFKEGKKLLVWLERCPGPGREEYLRVSQVAVEGGEALERDAVSLQLNTLTTVGLNNDNYWLDSGSIYQ